MELLNQYSSWTVPDGAGTTTSEATSVTVSGTGLSSGAATLYEDFTWARAGASPANGNNTYTAIASDSYGRSDTDNVTVYLPSSASYTYDDNGNLTSDGYRAFSYDDENQLITVLVTNDWKSEFEYDGKMRRRIRKEYSWTGSAWQQTDEVRYVYDGNLVIQERDGNNLPKITYTRGTDMSGTMQAAGGIGGLLARTENWKLNTENSANAHVLYHADGNGNITTLASTNGILLGRYHYDPFGNTLSINGAAAEANLYRFSSKEYHPNSGLVYYLYRYYDSNLQRWLNRDPIGENGGINLYMFNRNNSVSHMDSFGLRMVSLPEGKEAPPGFRECGYQINADGSKTVFWCKEDPPRPYVPPIAPPCPPKENNDPYGCWAATDPKHLSKIPGQGISKSGSCLARRTGCIDCCEERFPIDGGSAKDFQACTKSCQDNYDLCVALQTTNK